MRLNVKLDLEEYVEKWISFGKLRITLCFFKCSFQIWAQFVTLLQFLWKLYRRHTADCFLSVFLRRTYEKQETSKSSCAVTSQRFANFSLIISFPPITSYFRTLSSMWPSIRECCIVFPLSSTVGGESTIILIFHQTSWQGREIKTCCLTSCLSPHTALSPEYQNKSTTIPALCIFLHDFVVGGMVCL